MSRLLAVPVVASAAAGVGTLALLRVLWRVRDRPGARWLLATLLAQAVVCFAYTGAMLVSAPGPRFVLEAVTVVGIHWVGVPFLGFGLEYTGRSDLVGSWYYRILFLFPLVATVAVPTTPWHGLVWTGFEPAVALGVVGASYVNQPLLFLTIAGVTVATAAGALLLLETFLSYGPLYRAEAFAVGLSPLPPAAGVLAWLFGLGPAPAVNLTSALFLPHVLLDAYAFLGSDMFEFHPATRRAAERSALAELANPVIVLDESGRVVEHNPAATPLLRAEPVTEPLATALGASVDLDGESQRLTLRPAGQPREYRVTPAPLTDSGDNHVGYTLVFQDVTEEVRREQRLSVLNRVLRHNLRNDLSVVKGNVALARERVDGEVAEWLDAADAKVSELVATGEKARAVADTVRDAAAASDRVELRRLCAAVCEEVGEAYPGTAVTLADGPEVAVGTDPALLRAVLENLVENACEHGGSTVTVAVSRGSGTPTVTVDDDGPGIPAGELGPIRADRETSLEHGSGLGLWVVRWGTELLGGEVEFDTEAGTTVTVRLPGEG